MSNPRVWFISGSTSGFGRALEDADRVRGERVVATVRGELARWRDLARATGFDA